ncbi:MAG TPA: GNAT family N-acetyltransferase [Erwinia sp.]|uniref:GNAT family N-acetyltransferase n=1 Tax=Erwinia citreus TaxID=558 RepID=UPI000E816F9B|nr:GNAT family N-acetyltransferase [Erwinia sp.]HBV39355.1 GNAT family N-acetyltransferase [Erwinia sp.]
MTSVTYSLLTAEAADKARDELYKVLSACVALGASIGFISHDPEPMKQFWDEIVTCLASGKKRLLVARRKNEIVGTAIVEFCGKPNGSHRAEIAKLLVHPDARRQGIARELLSRAEQLASEQGKTLLVLDTRSGDAAEQLYLAQGWQICGQIPQFAVSIHGEYEATTVMYKMLTAAV